jgi:hypothetical protein
MQVWKPSQIIWKLKLFGSVHGWNISMLKRGNDTGPFEVENSVTKKIEDAVFSLERF